MKSNPHILEKIKIVSNLHISS